MTNAHFEPGDLVGHRYRVERLLGRGGTGAVYLARDLAEQGTLVAVKLLTSHGRDAAEIQILREELSVLSRLRHPNLVRILDFGVSDGSGVPYLVEEYLEGDDLFRATTGWPPKEILHLMVVLCRAVQFLHTRGIVHGDLKASNALLAVHETAPENLKVLDFGLARLPEGSRRPREAAALAYSAPELFLGKGVGPRSDLYSIGILFYLLLARRLPFEDEDAGFLIQKQLQGLVDLRHIERLEGGAGLAQLLKALLEKDPSKRPSSAEDVIRLASVASGEDYSGVTGSPLESYFSAGRFVGREREIEHLRGCATQVRENGRGKTVFVTGESGSGKSRCMEEFRIWALLEGWRVVEGSCRAGEEQSYRAYREVLAHTKGFAATDQANSQDSPLFRLEEDARVVSFPSFESSTETAAGQFRDQLTREIVRRVSGKPTILMLHDFHWADEATTAVLDYLTCDVQAHPILVCVSFRSSEVDQGAVGKLIESSVRQLRAECLALEALDEAAVKELIASMTGESVLEDSISRWIWQASGGNPFFVEEMLKHLVDRGLLQREEGRWKLGEEVLGVLEVPKSVAVVLRQRLERLPEKARELASWLAVVNRRISIDDLRSIVEWESKEFEQGLDALVQRQMIRREGEEGKEWVEFRHALISEVIRADQSPRERRRMHRRIGEALEREYGAEGHVQELAVHFTEANAGEKAVRYALEAAAKCRAIYANETALRFLEYVLKNEGGLTREELCQAAIDAADACCALGIPDRAVRLLRAQLKSGCDHDNSLGARILLQLALVYQHSGDLDLLESSIRRGLRLTHQKDFSGGPLIRGLLLSNLAYCRFVQSRPKKGLSILNDALRSLGNDMPAHLMGRISSLSALLHRVSCNLRTACKCEEIAIAALSSSREIDLLSAALSNHGSCLVALGRFSYALQQHRQAVELSETSRSVISRAQALGNLAEGLCRAGQVDEAIGAVERAHKVVSDSNNPAISYAFAAIHAEIKISSGDYKGAMRILDALSQTSRRNLALFTVGQVHYLQAALCFELGIFDAVRKHLKRLQQLNRREAPIYEYELGQVLNARIYYLQGSAGKAIRLLTALAKLAAKKHWPYQTCTIGLRLAEVLLSEDQIQSAQKHVGRSLRLAQAMGCLPLVALGHLIQGKILSQVARSGSAAPSRIGDNTRAKEEYLEAIRFAEQSVSSEVGWRAHAEVAKMTDPISDPETCLSHANKVLELLSVQERRMPLEMNKRSHWAPIRDLVRSEMTSLIQTCHGHSRGLIFPEHGMIEAHLRTLLRVSHTINAVRDLDLLQSEVADSLIRSLGVERALLFLRDAKTNELHLAKGRNVRQETILQSLGISQSVLRSVDSQGIPFVSGNVRVDPRVSDLESTSSFNPGTVMCAPLKVGGRVLGVLYADHSSPSGSLSESTIGLFAAFCNLAAIAIDNALVHRQLLEEKTELEHHLHEVLEGCQEIVGNSEVIQQLRVDISNAASSPLDVLICGESGTGKELVARAIHRMGRRSSGPFVTVDCGSFADTLVESELFGSRKGAFTGSTENRAGLIETASGGVFFLDEISNLTLKSQAKLLRVLEEREVRRLGEILPRRVDVLVVAATNRDLLKEIERGRFRKDLYYRLNAMEIQLPPLRQRLEDVPLLVDWFLEKVAKEERKIRRFTPEALAMLSSYPYPGNVRELKNIVLRCYFTAKEARIRSADLPPEVQGNRERSIRAEGSDESKAREIYGMIRSGKGKFLESVQIPFSKRQFGKGVVRQVIRRALVDSMGNYRQAFGLLGILETRYATTIQYLKRNDCYLDFRPFRNCARDSSHRATNP